MSLRNVLALILLAAAGLVGAGAPAPCEVGPAPSVEPATGSPDAVRSSREAITWLKSHGLYEGIQARVEERRYAARPREVTAVEGLAVGYEAANSAQGLRAHLSKLVPIQGKADDEFGWSVAIHASTAVVGAPSRETSGVFKGSVFVFVLDKSCDELGMKITEITVPDSPPGDQNPDGFGEAVAISEHTILVGAPRARVEGKLSAGAAYVFARSGCAWRWQAKLTARDGAAGDNFGLAVAVRGDTAVIGAPAKPVGGAAYVFTRSGTLPSWAQQSRLDGGSTAQVGDAFGRAVAISDNYAGNKTVAIGAPSNTSACSAPGAPTGQVRVFEASGVNWLPKATLKPGALKAGDFFGFSVGISGDTLVVGAPCHDPGGKPQGGQVYVFGSPAWDLQVTLSASKGLAGDLFGAAVGVQGDTLIVGSPSRDTPVGLSVGQAYVFTRNETLWGRATGTLGEGTEDLILDASPGASQQFFGLAVAISGSVAVVGIPFHDAFVGPDPGANPAHVFTLCPCRAAGQP